MRVPISCRITNRPFLSPLWIHADNGKRTVLRSQRKLRITADGSIAGGISVWICPHPLSFRQLGLSVLIESELRVVMTRGRQSRRHAKLRAFGVSRDRRERPASASGPATGRPPSGRRGGAGGEIVRQFDRRIGKLMPRGPLGPGPSIRAMIESARVAASTFRASRGSARERRRLKIGDRPQFPEIQGFSPPATLPSDRFGPPFAPATSWLRKPHRPAAGQSRRR